LGLAEAAVAPFSVRTADGEVKVIAEQHKLNDPEIADFWVI